MSYLDFAYPKGVGYPDIFKKQLESVLSNEKFPFWKKFESIKINGTKGFIVNNGVENGKKYCEIKSAIYLLTDMPISIELLNYRDEFIKSIESIWNNQKFTDSNDEEILIKTNLEVNLMPTYEVEVKTENVVDYKTEFSNGEVVLYVQNKLARSFISGSRRTGVMNSKDASPSTPAHEFGHVLGLSDRYCYFHFYIKGRVTLKERNNYNDSGDSHRIQMLQFNNLKSIGDFSGRTSEDLFGYHHIGEGSSVSMMEPYFSGDFEYGEKCNWKNNLMSLGGIGLTNYQLNHVCNQQIENDYKQYSFFAPSISDKNYSGVVPSIIGINEGKIIHDDYPFDVCSLEELKKLKQTSFGYYYFNPTIGANRLDVNSFYLEDGALNAEYLEKLEYGGNSRSQIIDKILDKESINYLNRSIKQLEKSGVQQGLKFFTSNVSDIYKKIGDGDELGKSIWSKSEDRIYKHWVTLQPDDAPNGKSRKVVNFELFRITKFYYYYNRRQIMEMYMYSK